MGIISATTDQDKKGVATLFTIPTVPRKKRKKVAATTKDKNVPITL